MNELLAFALTRKLEVLRAEFSSHFRRTALSDSVVVCRAMIPPDRQFLP